MCENQDPQGEGWFSGEFTSGELGAVERLIMEIQTYNTDPCCEIATKGLRNPSIRERLEDRKASLQADLKRVNDAIAALDAAPETAKVLELISKV